MDCIVHVLAKRCGHDGVTFTEQQVGKAYHEGLVGTKRSAVSGQRSLRNSALPEREVLRVRDEWEAHGA